MTTTLVTRHFGAIEWAARQGLHIDQQISHLDPAAIQPGDVVVMDGKQNVRPNSPLLERASEAKTGASAPAAQASQALAASAGGAVKP